MQRADLRMILICCDKTAPGTPSSLRGVREADAPFFEAKRTDVCDSATLHSTIASFSPDSRAVSKVRSPRGPPHRCCRCAGRPAASPWPRSPTAGPPGASGTTGKDVRPDLQNGGRGGRGDRVPGRADAMAASIAWIRLYDMDDDRDVDTVVDDYAARNPICSSAGTGGFQRDRAAGATLRIPPGTHQPAGSGGHDYETPYTRRYDPAKTAESAVKWLTATSRRGRSARRRSRRQPGSNSRSSSRHAIQSSKPSSGSSPKVSGRMERPCKTSLGVPSLR